MRRLAHAECALGCFVRITQPAILFAGQGEVKMKSVYSTLSKSPKQSYDIKFLRPSDPSFDDDADSFRSAAVEPFPVQTVSDASLPFGLFTIVADLSPLARQHPLQCRFGIHLLAISKSIIRRALSVASLKRLSIQLALGSALVVPSFATVVHQQEATPVVPLVQRFLTEGASVVSAGTKHSCRAFRAIDIRASRYVSPQGHDVAFADVARSPATGLWVIGAARETPAIGQIKSETTDDERIWRIVLKYPVKSLQMSHGLEKKDLTDQLDTSGDSVTLSAEDREVLQSAWRGGKTIKLIGSSLDTGRTVFDTLLPVAERDLEACDKYEQGIVPEDFAKADSEPLTPVDLGILDPFSELEYSTLWNSEVGTMGRTVAFDASRSRRGSNGPISVHWGARLPGGPDKADLAGCRMTDLGGEIERYRLSRVEGFISQSSEAWITRTETGVVQQIYIPGVFEALRQSDGEGWTSDVSIAAFANRPFGEPIYKGCLGSQAIAMAAVNQSVLTAPGDQPVPPVAKVGERFSLPLADVNLLLASADGFERMSFVEKEGIVPSGSTPEPVRRPLNTGQSVTAMTGLVEKFSRSSADVSSLLFNAGDIGSLSSQKKEGFSGVTPGFAGNPLNAGQSFASAFGTSARFGSNPPEQGKGPFRFDDPIGPDTTPDETLTTPAVVPLPGTIWFYLACFIALSLVVHSKRNNNGAARGFDPVPAGAVKLSLTPRQVGAAQRERRHGWP